MPSLPSGRPLVPAALLAPTAARVGAASARRAGRHRPPPPPSHDCRRVPVDVAGERIGANATAWLAAAPPPVWATRLVAALASALVSLAAASPALALGNAATPDLATATGDALLAASKKADAAADAVVGAAARLLPVKEKDATAAAAARDAAVALLQEVHDVVAINYMDARGAGLDRAAWDAALDKALSPPPRDAAAAHRAVRQMLAFALDDPYTRFLTPDEFRAMARYDVTGVGLNLGSGDEFSRRVGRAVPAAAAAAPAAAGDVWVIGLVRDSPADAAGVGQGDRVVGVNGVKVSDGASPFSIATAIAGAGTDGGTTTTRTLTLDVVKPDGSRATVSVSAPTAPAAVSPVSWRLAPPSARGAPPAAVIRLDSFNARAKADVEAALTAADAAGAASIVLDLRGNRGGLVTEGVEVAGLFLPPGAPVAVTLGARPDAERVLRVAGGGDELSSSTARAKWRRAPLTVLIDNRTASAAEIVAGALRDNCRAVLAGGGGGVGAAAPRVPGLSAAPPVRTYGKGLIQSVYELGDSSGLVLTVGKYLTPARADIDRGGIPADVAAPGAGPVDGATAAEVLGACRRAKGV